MNKPRAQAADDANRFHQPRTRATNRLCWHPSIFGNNRPILFPMPQRKKTNPEIEIKLRITDIPDSSANKKPIRHPPTAASANKTRSTTLRNPTSAAATCSSACASKPQPNTTLHRSAPRNGNPHLESPLPSSESETTGHPATKNVPKAKQVAPIASRQCAQALTALGFRPAFRYDKYPHHLPPARSPPGPG